MPVQIDGKELWTPKEVSKAFHVHESKLRRMAQLHLIPSISVNKSMRLYDYEELRQIDDEIWDQHVRGVKKPQGNHRYYSRLRRKTEEKAVS